MQDFLFNPNRITSTSSANSKTESASGTESETELNTKGKTDENKEVNLEDDVQVSPYRSSPPQNQLGDRQLLAKEYGIPPEQQYKC